MSENPPPFLAHLKLWPPDTCLVEQLVQALSGSDQRDFSSVGIVLPTRRLGTLTVAALSKKLGAIIPPTLFTFEDLLRQLTASDGRQCLSNEAWEMFISRMIELGDYAHLRPHHAKELRLLFDELILEEKTAHGFENLRAELSDNMLRDEIVLDLEVSKINEMEQLLQELFKQLAAGALRCPAQDSVERVNSLSAAALQQLLQERLGLTQLYLVGFTSLSLPMRRFLSLLSQSERAHIWLSAAPTLLAADSHPMEKIFATLGLEQRATSLSLRHHARPARIWQCDSPAAEVRQVLALVQQSLDAGVPPSAIGILVSSEATYGNLLRAYLKEINLTANVALSLPLAQAPLGQWLTCLQAACTAQAGQRARFAWHTHPITIELLTPDASEQDRRKLRRLVLASIQGGGNCEPPTTLPEYLTKAEALLKGWSSGSKRPLLAWTQDLQQLCAAVLSDKAHALRASSLECVAAFCRDAESIPSLRTQEIPASVFWSMTKQQLLGRDVRAVGEPLASVQVLNLTEARYFPFAKVFILGLTEGSFPKALPRDDLLDDYQKRCMGLSGWQMVEAIEEQTFRLFSARLPDLSFTYSLNQLNDTKVRSRFLDQLLIDNLATLAKGTWEAPQFWSAFIRPDEPRQMTQWQQEGQWPHDRSELFASMSATSAEHLIRCPYRYLLHRLHVDQVELPTDETDVRDEGEWLHQVLEAFFKAWPQDLSPETFSEFACQRLSALTRELGPDNIEHTGLYYHLQNFSWPRFAAHLVNIYGEDLARARGGHSELRLGQKPGAACASLSLAGLVVPVSGAIDRIDPMESGWIITDYKRQGLPLPYDLAHGISPQLVFYAAALPSISDDVLQDAPKVLGYWSILGGQWKPVGADQECKDEAAKTGLVSKRSPELSEQIKTVRGHLDWRARQLLEEKEPFYADASHCGRCSYQSICRRDDPSSFTQMQEQLLLAERLEAAP